MRRVLLFFVAEQAYALPIEEVGEVTFMAALSVPAARPAILMGFLTVGGESIAVVDLGNLLGAPARQPGLHTPLLLLRDNGLALMVESLGRETTVAADAIRPLDADSSVNGCVQAELTIGDQTAHLLSASRLLLEKERRCLEDLTEQERRRTADVEARSK